MSKRDLRRLDELLVQRGLAADLREAQALVMAGEVVVNDQRVDKPGSRIDQDAAVRLKQRRGPYVSRAGEKLAAALVDFSIATLVQGSVVLDVGASTGGFTDCCLKHGARLIYAVDVGTNQLDWSLRQDPRVSVFEQTDIREFTLSGLEPPRLVVVDVSFIGFRSIWPALAGLSAASEPIDLLILVKPQFEIARDEVPTGGVVVDPEAHAAAVRVVVESLEKAGYSKVRSCPSRVVGRSGNQEFFVHGSRVTNSSSPIAEES